MRRMSKLPDQSHVIAERRAARVTSPKFLYPCGCSHLKVKAGLCDSFDETGQIRENDPYDEVLFRNFSPGVPSMDHITELRRQLRKATPARRLLEHGARHGDTPVEERQRRHEEHSRRHRRPHAPQLPAAAHLTDAELEEVILLTSWRSSNEYLRAVFHIEQIIARRLPAPMVSLRLVPGPVSEQ